MLGDWLALVGHLLIMLMFLMVWAEIRALRLSIAIFSHIRQEITTLSIAVESLASVLAAKGEVDG